MIREQYYDSDDFQSVEERIKMVGGKARDGKKQHKEENKDKK